MLTSMWRPVLRTKSCQGPDRTWSSSALQFRGLLMSSCPMMRCHMESEDTSQERGWSDTRAGKVQQARREPHLGH